MSRGSCRAIVKTCWIYRCSKLHPRHLEETKTNAHRELEPSFRDLRNGSSVGCADDGIDSRTTAVLILDCERSALLSRKPLAPDAAMEIRVRGSMTQSLSRGMHNAECRLRKGPAKRDGLQGPL